MNTVGLMWPPIEPRSDLPFSSSEPDGTVTGAPLDDARALVAEDDREDDREPQATAAWIFTQ
jgi:hypothetical protein